MMPCQLSPGGAALVSPTPLRLIFRHGATVAVRRVSCLSALTATVAFLPMKKAKDFPEVTSESDQIPLAVAYRTLAADFQLSAKELLSTLELKEDGRPARYTAIPFLFLVSHAAELYLKAALLKRGFTAQELKKYDYRHNLKTLMAALQEKGVSITSSTVALISGLHSQHQMHALRYSVFVDDGQKTYVPPLAATLDMLDELLMLTRISTQGV